MWRGGEGRGLRRSEHRRDPKRACRETPPQLEEIGRERQESHHRAPDRPFASQLTPDTPERRTGFGPPPLEFDSTFPLPPPGPLLTLSPLSGDPPLPRAAALPPWAPLHLLLRACALPLKVDDRPRRVGMGAHQVDAALRNTVSGRVQDGGDWRDSQQRTGHPGPGSFDAKTALDESQ